MIAMAARVEAEDEDHGRLVQVVREVVGGAQHALLPLAGLAGRALEEARGGAPRRRPRAGW